MGKKKRPKTGDAALPVFFAKKRKISEETNLTALVALTKYCAKFKIGTPGFRQRSASPFNVVVVLDGSEFGAARHADRDAAMEKACLLTLNLLDPEGKSIIANIPWPSEPELKAMQVKIANAKQDTSMPGLFAPPVPGAVAGLAPGAPLLQAFPAAYGGYNPYAAAPGRHDGAAAGARDLRRAPRLPARGAARVPRAGGRAAAAGRRAGPGDARRRGRLRPRLANPLVTISLVHARAADERQPMAGAQSRAVAADE
ncbi:hypothetical protein SO694_000114132 [Aureococcus anophagefferens]|uniref:DRBM domain-containing protein n=1 Tax=Aureococcus anophagefferens TaxID=44056 RepID=A0ABR1GFG1_AURAN